MKALCWHGKSNSLRYCYRSRHSIAAKRDRNGDGCAICGSDLQIFERACSCVYLRDRLFDVSMPIGPLTFSLSAHHKPQELLSKKFAVVRTTYFGDSFLTSRIPA